MLSVISNFSIDKKRDLRYNDRIIRKQNTLYYLGEYIVESGEDDDNCRSTYIVLKKYIS